MSSFLQKYKKVYLLGIKGVGMTMLAQFLKEKGVEVTGSDISEKFLTDAVLKKEKIKVLNFSEKNIKSGLGVVINSSAYTAANNAEMAKLATKKIKTLTYAEALGDIFNQHYGVAVCGSHGKTTTSAWLGYVLWRGELDPNVLVGSSVSQFKGSSLVGSSRLFVAECDEYQNKLQYFKPQGVVLNNIDYDHPDFFKTKSAYYQVFEDFITKIPSDGFLVTNHSDEHIRKLYSKNRGWLLNYEVVSSKAEYLKKKEAVRFLAYNHYFKDGYQYFTVNEVGEFKIKMIGCHNVYNALAVIAAAYALGMEMPVIKKHLATFTGTTRRAQLLGNYNEIPVYDDYAHHPTEVKATLAAFKETYKNKKIVAVFHPHTFTRTLALFDDFKSSFKDANKLIIIDIYGSAREEQGGVSSSELITAIKDWNKKQGIKQTVVYQKNLDTVQEYLKKTLKNKDLLLLMGAGDIFRVGQKLIKS
jgi:UDP-N-acetylmuramate--alanine ligase